MLLAVEEGLPDTFLEPMPSTRLDKNAHSSLAWVFLCSLREPEAASDRMLLLELAMDEQVVLGLMSKKDSRFSRLYEVDGPAPLETLKKQTNYKKHISELGIKIILFVLVKKKT